MGRERRRAAQFSIEPGIPRCDSCPPLDLTACVALAHDFSHNSTVMQVLDHNDAAVAVSNNVYSRARPRSCSVRCCCCQEEGLPPTWQEASWGFGQQVISFQETVAEASQEGGEVNADFGSAIGGRIGRFF
ncbi:hypothetical protein LEN26_019316 [Aphanomyces euteiches]|nr:hypothetical protein LEN26_019316 [Aphanomyces euteiches]KAH9125140.1 hypothetical protein AeMF1_004205 [Aphanomyces euteiches]KAH9188485.1 hypothetical protein AeNC1_009538 [Aphanomyces euteiches]